MNQGLLTGLEQSATRPNQPLMKSESQDAYNLFSGQIQRFIWKTHYDKIVSSFKKMRENIVGIMAQQASSILSAVFQSARVSGKMLSPKIVYSAAKELMISLIEIAQHEKVLSDDWDRAGKEAFFHALAQFAQQNKDKLKPEEVKEYMQLMQQDKQYMQGGENESSR